MRRIAIQDARFLEAQLGFYDPDLIVCCGQVVSDYLKRTIGWASGLDLLDGTLVCIIWITPHCGATFQLTVRHDRA